ncbi:phosphonoacetaldehyde hydrolase [Bacillus xiapuensis]|uniref:phosphonoacetaldehyde hydrolase n=1 Tax=Bacillus xiapuensis TaxID=2014075 RepID=UPI003AF32F75
MEDLYAEFEPALLASQSAYTDPIPEVIETVQELRTRGLKIGSTTGYTNSMMEVVVPNALKKGYHPDFYITADEVHSYGRPYPYMIFRNMEQLKITTPWKVVKVGDTIFDIKEGNQAGVWSVGVIIGSSEMGLSLEEFQALSESDQAREIAKTRSSFFHNGADFTITTMSELPELIEEINKFISDGKRPSCAAESNRVAH